jgi:hypothetical protein
MLAIDTKGGEGIILIPSPQRESLFFRDREQDDYEKAIPGVSHMMEAERWEGG